MFPTLFSIIFLFSCHNTGKDQDTAQENSVAEYSNCQSELGAEMTDVLTPHFQMWLLDNGYDAEKMARIDLLGGSFGGFVSAEDCIQQEPVIFIHGNSDRAIGGVYDGWFTNREYFLSHGYRSAELYATTYGEPELESADQYFHSKENILQIRNFIEAVLEYTKADKIDIISHSLGVTMARRAILGGAEADSDGNEYQIGVSLTDKIDSFIGIAGANQGLASCAFASTAVCGEELGLYPGWWDNGVVSEQAQIIQTLNSSLHYEGEYVYSIWSKSDQILGANCLVWGKNSCLIPSHDGEYSSMEDHFGVRSETADIQLQMVLNHQLD